MSIELQILSRLDEVGNSLNNVLEQFNEKIKYDSHKDRQIDRLHRELQEYKSDLLAGSLRPILSRLIRLLNDTVKLSEQVERGDVLVSPEQVPDIIRSLAYDIEHALLDQGVEVFHDKSGGNGFNPHRQQAIGAVETDNAAKSGQIAQRLRPGYEYGRMVLQKERVTVFSPTKLGERPSTSVDSQTDATVIDNSATIPEATTPEEPTGRGCAPGAAGSECAFPLVREQHIAAAQSLESA